MKSSPRLLESSQCLHRRTWNIHRPSNRHQAYRDTVLCFTTWQQIHGYGYGLNCLWLISCVTRKCHTRASHESSPGAKDCRTTWRDRAETMTLILGVDIVSMLKYPNLRMNAADDFPSPSRVNGRWYVSSLVDVSSVIYNEYCVSLLRGVILPPIRFSIHAA